MSIKNKYSREQIKLYLDLRGNISYYDHASSLEVKLLPWDMFMTLGNLKYAIYVEYQKKYIEMDGKKFIPVIDNPYKTAEEWIEDQGLREEFIRLSEIGFENAVYYTSFADYHKFKGDHDKRVRKKGSFLSSTEQWKTMGEMIALREKEKAGKQSEEEKAWFAYLVARYCFDDKDRDFVRNM